jgi:general secretion pathway protein G
VIYLQERAFHKIIGGDVANAIELPGRRVILSPAASARRFGVSSGSRGFTLIELVITVTVLTILTMGVVPLMKLSVKRQKEQQLRDTLRQIRSAIDEFHRDTVGMTCTGTAVTQGGAVVQPPTDPRSKVIISDCTIFGVDNPDRYPPDIDTLINGVNVIPRGNASGAGVAGVNATQVGNPELSTKKKVYLRGTPIDPMTGKNDWEFRSCYDPADGDSWGGENLFDVRSKSKETALNGEKYSDW